MVFSRIFGAEPPYIRRARACLEEARMSALEHSMAAEHYQSSAAMYNERARRLEEEIAAWEVNKNGAPVLDAVSEMPTVKYTPTGRIEGLGTGAVPASPATVGIVRAA